MAFMVNQRNVDQVMILDAAGKLTIGEGDIKLRISINDSLNAGARNLLVNLAGVSTIDEDGVGELVRAYVTTSDRGGKLKLLNLPPKIQDVLTITQLITVFEVYDNEPEAVASFG